MKIKGSSKFLKSVKRLRKSYPRVSAEVDRLFDVLETGELPGDQIVGTTHPAYKVRLPNRDANRGKSGGFRVVYVTVVGETIYLIAIYSKSDTASLSAAEINILIEELPEADDSPGA